MFTRSGVMVLGALLAVGLLVGFAADAQAAVTPLNWNTAGGADGNLVGVGQGSTTGSISVTGLSISAASIAGFTTGSGTLPSGHYGCVDASFGGGTFSGNVAFTMEIRVGGSWTQIWSGSVATVAGTGFQTVPLAGNEGPITFPGGQLRTVTGIRLTATADATALGGWGNLSTLNSGTVFNFDTNANPEPATLLLVAAGVGGLAWSRRRKHRKDEA